MTGGVSASAHDITGLGAPRISAPRRRNAIATRAAILKAARTQFALKGYDHVSLRDIAAEAGVDVALVNRYFGAKAGVFLEALKVSIQFVDILESDRATFSGRMARAMADHIFEDEAGMIDFQFLLRAAASAATAPLLNAALQERFLQPISDWLGGGDASVRARLLAAIFIGLLAESLIRGKPLTGQERTNFIERSGVIIEGLIANADTP